MEVAMIITFCGHSDFLFDNTVKEKLSELLIQGNLKQYLIKFTLNFVKKDGIIVLTLL